MVTLEFLSPHTCWPSRPWAVSRDVKENFVSWMYYTCDDGKTQMNSSMKNISYCSHEWEIQTWLDRSLVRKTKTHAKIFGWCKFKLRSPRTRLVGYKYRRWISWCRRCNCLILYLHVQIPVLEFIICILWYMHFDPPLPIYLRFHPKESFHSP